jgi:hypothetical protein
MGKSKETNTPYWVQIYQRSLKEVQEWFDLKKTIVRFVLIAVVLVVGLVRWGGVNFAFAQVQNLLLPELITIIVLILINPIVAVPHMFWVAAKRDSEQRKILSASEGPIENAISLDVDNDFRDNDGNQIVSIKVKNLMDDELVCYASAKSIVKWIEAGREKSEDISFITHAGSLFSWSGGSNQGHKNILPDLIERVNVAEGKERQMRFLLQYNMGYFEQYANAMFILEIEIGGKMNNRWIKPYKFVGNLEFHKAEQFSFLPQQEDQWLGSDTDGNYNIDLSQYEPYDDISYRLLILKQGDPRGGTIEK